MSSIKEQVCTNPSFSLPRGYICWGYTNFKAMEASSFECQLCSVVFSGERALWSLCKLDHLCELVEKKILVTFLRKALRLPKLYVSLWNGALWTGFRNNRRFICMENSSVKWGHMWQVYVTYSERSRRKTCTPIPGFYVSRLQYGGHAALNGSVKKNNPGKSFIIFWTQELTKESN